MNEFRGPEVKEANDKAALVADGRRFLLMKQPDCCLAPLPDELGRAVVMVEAGLASGHAVVVAESGTTVTSARAAEMLGVSRPMVARWITEELLADAPVETLLELEGEELDLELRVGQVSCSLRRALRASKSRSAYSRCSHSSLRMT